MVAYVVCLQRPAEPPLHSKLVAGVVHEVVNHIAEHEAQQEPRPRRPGHRNCDCPYQRPDRNADDFSLEIADRIVRITLVIAMDDEDGPLEQHRPGPEMEDIRPEEQTFELKSIMRISYPLFSLNKK